MLTSWSSYPSIYALGHRAVKELTSDPVWIEEKIDGSQFSFGAFENEGGEIIIKARSKGAQLVLEAPPAMFVRAVETVLRLAPRLHVGWTYRGEYLAKPHHNGLVYNRVPDQHIIIFDINTGYESYLDQIEKRYETLRLGLEVVPVLHTGMADLTTIRRLLETTSVLGGQKIEGVVVKPQKYDLFGPDKRCLMGKFVSEAFKEVQSKMWQQGNPTNRDVIDRLSVRYTSSARWMKAVQHLREAGELEGSPRDIGALMREVPVDIERECREAIKKELFEWAWPQVRRVVVRGLPEWYKERLLEEQFHEKS